MTDLPEVRSGTHRSTQTPGRDELYGLDDSRLSREGEIKKQRARIGQARIAVVSTPPAWFENAQCQSFFGSSAGWFGRSPSTVSWKRTDFLFPFRGPFSIWVDRRDTRVMSVG